MGPTTPPGPHRQLFETKLHPLPEDARAALASTAGPYVLESTEVFELAKQGRVLRARTIGVDKTPFLKLSALARD